MSKVRYEPNPRLRAELGRDGQMHEVLQRVSADLRKATGRNLPGRGRSAKPFVAKWISRVENPGEDVEVLSGTSWPIGHIIEFGSVNNPAYSPLRKGVRDLGLKFGGG